MREIRVAARRADQGDCLFIRDRLRFGITRTTNVQPSVEGVAGTCGVSLVRHDPGNVRPAEDPAAGDRAYLIYGYVYAVVPQHPARLRQPLHTNGTDPVECRGERGRVRIDEVAEDVRFRRRYRRQLDRRDHLYAALASRCHRLVHAVHGVVIGQCHRPQTRGFRVTHQLRGGHRAVGGRRMGVQINPVHPSVPQSDHRPSAGLLI